MSIENATDLFWDSFNGGGANSIDCACGRHHFSRKGDFETEEELTKLLNQECGQPDCVIGTDDDSVGYATVNGIILCYGCPCGSAAKYESFLINEQESILSYYRKLKEKKRAELQVLDDGLSNSEVKP